MENSPSLFIFMFFASSDFSALKMWILPLNVSDAGVSLHLGHLFPI